MRMKARFWTATCRYIPKPSISAPYRAVKLSMAEADRIRMNGTVYSAPPRMSVERDEERRRVAVKVGSVDSSTIVKLSRWTMAAAMNQELSLAFLQGLTLTKLGRASKSGS